MRFVMYRDHRQSKHHSGRVKSNPRSVLFQPPYMFSFSFDSLLHGCAFCLSATLPSTATAARLTLSYRCVRRPSMQCLRTRTTHAPMPLRLLRSFRTRRQTIPRRPAIRTRFRGTIAIRAAQCVSPSPIAALALRPICARTCFGRSVARKAWPVALGSVSLGTACGCHAAKPISPNNSEL